MGTRAAHPAAQALLGWMQTNGGRLRTLLAEEAAHAVEADRDADLSPAGDAAIRAHLRFVSEALAASSGPGDGTLAPFAASLPGRLDAAAARGLDAELDLVGDATAFELQLQFGSETAEDRSLIATVERRLRLAAWTRVFLAALDEARPDAPVGPEVLAWMNDRQARLADTIFAMDRRAKEAEIARGGPGAVDDQDVVNRIGQAAMLQASTRFLVEALAATLAAPVAAR